MLLLSGIAEKDKRIRRRIFLHPLVLSTVKHPDIKTDEFFLTEDVSSVINHGSQS